MKDLVLIANAVGKNVTVTASLTQWPAAVAILGSVALIGGFGTICYYIYKRHEAASSFNNYSLAD